MTDQNKEFSFTTKVLEREKFSLSYIPPEPSLGAYANSAMEVRQDFDSTLMRMRAELAAYILKEPLGHSTEVRYYDIDEPASWFQHLKMGWKDDFVSRWLLKRWPIKYKTKYVKAEFRIEHAAIYPEANIAVPALGRPIPYHVIKEIS